MVETDWREILNYSQKELKQTDKEKLCESLSWMEADDIELNFSDLKSLFRLAQDMLKFKSEQVNSLLSQVETLKRKYGKAKGKNVTMAHLLGMCVSPLIRNSLSYIFFVCFAQTDRTYSRRLFLDSPARDVLETTQHDELLKANKEILEKLYSEIAELERRKSKYMEEDSESSRDALSEMGAIAQLEDEVVKKNRHIRKLLNDVKTLEEENATLKEKLSVFKDKLKESTLVIENLTEQLFTLNSECSQLKIALGNSEEEKNRYKVDIESSNKKIQDKTSKKNVVQEELKNKLQQFKDIIKEQNNEIKQLKMENIIKKEEITKLKNNSSPSKQHENQELKVRELQEKLEEASRQMIESAELINILKKENHNLKKNIKFSPCEHEQKVDVKDTKEKNTIKSLQKQIMRMTCELHGAEEMIALREKELTEITAQLQLLQTDNGIRTLLIGLKNKKQQMRVKDDGIKSLVEEVNSLNQQLNDIQIENECMREQLNLPINEKVNTTGFLKVYYDTKQENVVLTQKLKEIENKLLTMEVENRVNDKRIAKLVNVLKNMQYPKEKLDTILNDDDAMEDSCIKQKRKKSLDQGDITVSSIPQESSDYQRILEENEALRSSLSEILNCLKDNSTTTSGILTLECPSLDSVLQSMEARKIAGWFAPHMKTVLELRTALGGRDALLTALHESRKETFEVMHQLSKESKKAIELEKELTELKSNVEAEKESVTFSDGEFGPWILENEYNIDFEDTEQIQNILAKGEKIYENQIKYCLTYFQNKFKTLYEKLTNLVITVKEEKNKWLKQEENYKIEIVKLRAQMEDDISEPSPGLVENSNLAINLKCNFLQENYKYLRTLNENLTNECLESKKGSLITISDYERKVQDLMAVIINITDRLRHSIPIDVFWRQNNLLNECNLKYRKLLENNTSDCMKSVDFLAKLNKTKADIMKSFEDQLRNGNIENTRSEFQNSIAQKQLVLLSNELDSKTKEIQQLNTTIEDLQKAQNQFINQLSSTLTDEEMKSMKEDLKTVSDENKALKEHCQHLNSKLDLVTTQLQAYTQKELTSEVELDFLRHQILDLQSSGQKAVVSRLSNEILISHLQATENLHKVESLKLSLNKERQLRLDVEDILHKQQKKFDIYVTRNNLQFRNMFDIIEVLRNQYQGIIPTISIENYLKSVEESYRKNVEVDAKLNDIEDIRNNLMIKHTVCDQILNLKPKCGDACPHKIKYMMLEKSNVLELDHCNKKIATIEQSRDHLLQRYNKLEKTLLLINQGFKPKTFEKTINTLCTNDGSVEVEDVQSDSESNDKGNETYTLSPKSEKNSPIIQEKIIETKAVYTQTIIKTENKEIQANDQAIKDLKSQIEILKSEKKKYDQKFNEILVTYKEQSQDMSLLRNNINQVTREKSDLEENLKRLKDSYKDKNVICHNLQTTADNLQKQLNDLRNNETARAQSKTDDENKSLLLIKKLENDKKYIIEEYKNLLNNERDEFAKSIHEFQTKIAVLQLELDNKGNNVSEKPVPEKLNTKIAELEDKCFKLNTELETCESDLKTCNAELERWKNLASERLTKMEHLSNQLKERHNQEVDSYKAENEHWLLQLNETQREHVELRNKLGEQKSLHIKQMAEKDAHIEHLRSVINNLKTQIINMQTMISINDPSFDLSAIVEVEEASDAISHQDSDRLELKFGSTGDLNEQDDLKFPSSSTAIWQEPLIERLRREKQQVSKQNAILRKQIKVLAGRERRARLDAQNLKNQVFRISTSGNKVSSVESATLQNKIASLQAQLTSARRDAHSTVALWDKWKRAQQSSDRWQTKYEEKCQEVIKLESSLNLARSSIQRLEKEKRMLLSRLEAKNTKTLAIEKHDCEPSEKSARPDYCEMPPVSTKALVERIEAQQRRIVALEFAEKGNEPLVSEYEKSLAEITSLKGQVLKLESALLEAQIKSPLKSSQDYEPELEYWKSYCEMLKEENVQLSLRVSSLECAPASSQRVNDLEQTVLTLRGLVSKLQAEQKSSHAISKRPDSRPTSGRNSLDRNRNTNSDSLRIEISNLKQIIHEKDLLLEKSKEMLKIAADREEDLLQENVILRRRLEHVTDNQGGAFSA
ncbi:centrosomal protein of 290 kDa [Pieris napi]|uniref:centrosomal protein of 290 kDa n=1 Tax=Pieris napi TaxID=78633 RepID=UPI001FBA817A|nr:centrosomal protein of 290 kDa [Pieris napi]